MTRIAFILGFSLIVSVFVIKAVQTTEQNIQNYQESIEEVMNNAK